MSTVYLLCGTPASGKTTLATNLPFALMAEETINIIQLDRDFLYLTTGSEAPEIQTLGDLNNEKKMEAEILDLVELGEDIIIDSAIFVEQWRLEKWINYFRDLNLKVKVIIMSTPLDIIMERYHGKRNDISANVSESEMAHLYNNFIMTVGWLYIDHPEKIINSAHLL